MFLSHLKSLCAGSMLVLCSACGGGGGDSVTPENSSESTAPPDTTGPVAPASISYFNGVTLPGRLMVTRAFGDINVYDLASGARTHVGNEDDNVEWIANSVNPTVMRYDADSFSGLAANSPISFFDSRQWAPPSGSLVKAWPDLALKRSYSYPKLSPDGRYVLTFHRDADLSGFNDPLTIFDRSTGNIVKSGMIASAFDNEFSSILSSPADWLPDGSYVYLAKNKLYASSPSTMTEWLVATLDLPDNQATGGKSSDFVFLSASPDGKKLAFNWGGNLWVVNVDGTDLHRITSIASDSVNQALGSDFGSPTWSPDSRWVAGVLYRSGVVTAPVYPNPDATLNPAYQVIGTTGCNSPVFVLPADARSTVITWPEIDPGHNLKVRSGVSLAWLTVCSSRVFWLP